MRVFSLSFILLRTPYFITVFIKMELYILVPYKLTVVKMEEQFLTTIRAYRNGMKLPGITFTNLTFQSGDNTRISF
jgi:hypothetical protein